MTLSLKAALKAMSMAACRRCGMRTATAKVRQTTTHHRNRIETTVPTITMVAAVGIAARLSLEKKTRTRTLVEGGKGKRIV